MREKSYRKRIEREEPLCDTSHIGGKKLAVKKKYFRAILA